MGFRNLLGTVITNAIQLTALPIAAPYYVGCGVAKAVNGLDYINNPDECLEFDKKYIPSVKLGRKIAGE